MNKFVATMLGLSTAGLLMVGCGGGGGASPGTGGATGSGGAPGGTGGASSGSGGAQTGSGGSGGVPGGSGGGTASPDSGVDAAGSGGSTGATDGAVESAGEAAGGAENWETFAKGFFETYCVSCHNDDKAGAATRDYHMMAIVVREKIGIACGVAKSQADWTKRGCSGFPPARQFPVGNGPKPNDADRDRLLRWFDSGTP